MLVLLSFHFIYWQHFVRTTLVVVMLGVTTGVITVLICFHFPAERLKKKTDVEIKGEFYVHVL